ncbi:MAG: hypothetical protein PHS33_08785 [Candidatus Omnitrophica bacterium]|jgi:hypothetical protein|nr:hypothetical protein [Candidatus Omnitrophota bacterium]
MFTQYELLTLTMALGIYLGETAHEKPDEETKKCAEDLKNRFAILLTEVYKLNVFENNEKDKANENL